jgi:hypothetical protein
VYEKSCLQFPKLVSLIFQIQRSSVAKKLEVVETAEILKILVKLVAQPGVFWKGGKEVIGLWFHTLNALYGVEYFESLLILPGAKAILRDHRKNSACCLGQSKGRESRS